MKIAIAGGGPGGLYFAALMKQLDPRHEVTVWERNAAEDTFGFGVVFSDETLGGIESADTVVYEQLESRFARWTDIDIEFNGAAFTVGGQGFAALSRKQLLQILQARAEQLGVTVHYRAHAPDPDELRACHDLVVAADGLNSAIRTKYADVFLPVPGRAEEQVHLARHRPGLRGVPVLRQADGLGHDADPRLPVLRLGLDLHRRDARGRVAPGRLRRHRGPGLPAWRLRRARGRPDRGDLRRRARRPRGADQQLQVAQLHHRPQPALVRRQPGAAGRRRPHRALLDRVGHQAGHGGRARAGRLPARAARGRSRRWRPTRPSGSRSWSRPSARRRPRWSGSRTSACTPARTRPRSAST